MSIAARHPFRSGLWFLGVSAALLIFALGINISFGLPFNLSISPPGTDYSLKASFADANGVTRGADVVIAGHPIGQVTDVRVDGQHSMVTMRINRNYAPLHKGTIARIRYSTLLAQKYVELTPIGGASVLADGATIPSDQTVTPVDFDQFLSSLDAPTRARLQVLVQQAGDGVAGRQLAINDFLDQLHGLSVESRGGLDTMAQHQSDVQGIVTNLAITSDRLAQSSDQLADLVGAANTVNAALVDEDAQLVALIHHLADVMSAFNVTLDGEQQNLHQTVVLLDPLVGQLNVAFGTVDGYLGPALPALQQGFSVLTPEGESAISQRDANGNYLRQYLVADQGCDQLNSSFNPKCGQGDSNPDRTSSPNPPSSSSSSAASPAPAGGAGAGAGSGSGSGSGGSPQPAPTCDPVQALLGNCKP